MKVFRLPFNKSHLGIYLSRLLKGCLLLLTILVAVSKHDASNHNLINYIIVAFVAMTASDIYCHVIGEQIHLRKTLTAQSYERLFWEWFPQMIPGIVGALLIVLSDVGLVPRKIAFTLIDAGCFVVMILCCYISQRLCSHRGWRAVYPTLITAALGGGFVFLRALITGLPPSH